MSTRSGIQMSAEELAQFIDSNDIVVVASLGEQGFPHVVPLWFIRDGSDILAWSYAKSRKVRNLRRDRRATLMFEAGVSYTELHGASLECHTEVIDDPTEIAEVGRALAERYQKGVSAAYSAVKARAVVDGQVARRSVLRFHPVRTTSWDHSKMSLPAAPA